jgi:DNA-nicking Smr family endonuclease
VRQLDPEEAALWSLVTATIRPLSREPQLANPAPVKSVAQPSPVLPSSKAKGRVPPARPSVPAIRARPTVHGNLDGHWERRLRGGTVAVDRTLDLHGHSLDAAWEAIDRVIEQAVAAGDRVILLVTGHHRPGEPPVQRGKIRAAVHDWLAVSRHADRIAAVRSAHRRHGGGGSLYLILRR